MSTNMIMNEAATLHRLRHMNIVGLQGVYKDTYKIYLVMEHFCGGDLCEALHRARTFCEGDAASLMQQVLRGVNYMHHQQVCHRDLKPENFLLSSASADFKACGLKIVDFGCAWGFESFDETSDKDVGTERYKAPEVLRGSYTYVCDNWACGVVAFVLLCGACPFRTAAATRQRPVSFSHPSWEATSETAREFILKLLEKDPQARLSAEAALAHPWLASEGSATCDEPLPQSALDSLRGFGYEGMLRKAALNAVVRNFNSEEVARLQEHFLGLDTNQDGTVSIAELRDAMRQAGASEKCNRLRELVEAVDLDGNGTIDYHEFLAGSVERSRYFVESTCYEVFRKFDVDGNGVITKMEWRRVLADPTLRGIVEKHGGVEDIFKECDRNDDDVLCFDEFYHMLQLE